MQLSDFLAVAAIVVSLGSAYWTSQVERRLQKQADARYAFDGMLGGPIESKLAALERIVEALVETLLDAEDAVTRREKLSVWQRIQFTPWYVSLDAMLAAQTQFDLRGVSDILILFPDALADPFNQLGEDLSEPEVISRTRTVTVATTTAIAEIRAQLHELRLRY